jgi:hypothetical protein
MALTETERLGLDFMIAALREGDRDVASLAYEPQEAAFIGGITKIVGKTFRITQQVCPVAVQTVRLTANIIGGGRAALSDPRTMSELNQLRDRSLVDLLVELREGGGQGGGQRGFSGTGSNVSQLSTQELFEELRRRTSR